MNEGGDAGGSAARVPLKLLRCNACGRTVNCTDAELLGYVRDGWPRCCGETMTLFVEATRSDRPGGHG